MIRSLAGMWWLCAYPVSGLAVRPVGAPEAEEQVLLEWPTHTLKVPDWAANGLVFVSAAGGTFAQVLLLQLESQQ